MRDSDERPENEEKTWRIGEVAEILQMETSALRFWEKEFPQLRPLRTQRGQRLYTARDVEILRQIRELLYEQGLTIEGARKALERPAHSPSCDMSVMGEVLSGLQDLRNMLATGKIS